MFQLFCFLSCRLTTVKMSVHICLFKNNQFKKTNKLKELISSKKDPQSL